MRGGVDNDAPVAPHMRKCERVLREIKTRQPTRTRHLSVQHASTRCISNKSLVSGMTGVSSASRDVRCMGLFTTMCSRDIRRAWRSDACGRQFTRYR